MQEKKRINKEGELVFTSTRTRSQACVLHHPASSICLLKQILIGQH